MGGILRDKPHISQSIDCINSIDLIYRAPSGRNKIGRSQAQGSALPRRGRRYAPLRACGRTQLRQSADAVPQLKKLEEYLGVQLIERAPKRVALTAAGEEIVERARRIVEASEEIVELARGHRDPLAGRLRLAFLPTIGPYL